MKSFSTRQTGDHSEHRTLNMYIYIYKLLVSLSFMRIYIYLKCVCCMCVVYSLNRISNNMSKNRFTKFYFLNINFSHIEMCTSKPIFSARAMCCSCQKCAKIVSSFGLLCSVSTNLKSLFDQWTNSENWMRNFGQK